MLKLNDFFSQDRVWRFCRGGGEVLAITARLARTVALNSRILVCGYHGTHDWYLSANLNANNSLSQVFLSGISPAGLPDEYKNTTYSLSNLDLSSNIFSNHCFILFDWKIHQCEKKQKYS